MEPCFSQQVAFNKYGVKLLRNGLLRMKNGQQQMPHRKPVKAHRHSLFDNPKRQPTGRTARRADRIRDKIGWEAGILNGAEPWNRPKGMHQATFDRLRWKHDRFVSHALADFAEQFGFDLEDKHRF